MTRRGALGSMMVAAALASVASCTALLGLDDKTFDLAGGGVGGAGGTGGMSSGSASGGGGAGAGGGAGGGTQCDTPPVGNEPRGTILWAKASAGSAGAGAELGALALDPCGSIWITGTFIETVSFEGCTAQTTNAGSAVFVAKLSPEGACETLWSFSPDGFADTAYGTGIALASDGYPVVVGTYDGSFLGSTSLNDRSDVFALKVSPTGDAEWFMSDGGVNDDVAGEVAIDGQGRVLVAAALRQADTTTDAVVLRYTPDGTPLNPFTLDATGSSGVSGITVAPGGDIGVTGWLSGGITTPGESFSVINEAAFAAVLTPDMDIEDLWASRTNLTSRGLAVAFSGDGGFLYMGGAFYEAFGLDQNEIPLVTQGSDEDGFVVRIGLTGGNGAQYAQLTQASGPLVNERVEALSVDASNEVVLAGAIQGPSRIESTEITPVSSDGGDDAVVARMGTGFTAHVWGAAYGGDPGGSFNQVAQSVGIDPSRSVLVVGGTFSSNLDLGTVSLVEAEAMTAVFIAAIKQ